MGSVSIVSPARLGHAGYVALVGGLAQADPAETELAVDGARPAAAPAAVVAAGLELGFATLLDLHRSLGHLYESSCFSASCDAASPAGGVEGGSLPAPRAHGEPPA